ncbi:hypothetical protein ONZ45_g1937 [Pleurotus djamor]|nr:hypothetical protein ONZ45_g1937 [Pleurotus djamor]
MLCRGKRSIAITPKVPSGLDTLKRLIMASDVLIEPFRPGVMERLGLGPEVFLGDGKTKGLHEKLIYVRIVGFPRTGPHKDLAGHDLNYLALSGVLSMLPGPDKPSFPGNILADFAGGGFMGAFGVILALIEREKTGKGKVVNIDMVSGVRYISTFPLLASLDSSDSTFGKPRGQNALDGGAPFYNIYTCKDGRWMTVACLEPQFFIIFLTKFLEALPTGFALEDGWRPDLGVQGDKSQWPKLKEFFEKGFMTETRDYWAKIYDGPSFSPALTSVEAAVLDASHSPIPVPHPQFKNHADVKLPRPELLTPGTHTYDVLAELGLSSAEVHKLAKDGALGDDVGCPVGKSKL